MHAAARDLSDALRCTSNLLSQLGIDTSPNALRDRVGPSPSQESWAELVRAHGRSARLVRVTPSDLPRLACPTLLLEQGMPTYVLCRVQRKLAHVELPDGSRRTLPTRQLLSEATLALEVSTPLSGLASLRARIATLLGAELRTVLQLVLMSALLAGATLVGPLLTREAMDRALPNQAPRLLLAVVCGILLTGAQRTYLSWLREHVSIALRARNSHALLRDGLAHVLGLPYAALSQHGLGALLQASASTEAVARLVTTLGVRPLLDGLFGLAAVLVIAQSSPALALALPAAGMLAAGIAALLARRQAAFRRQQVDATARERARLHELVQGIATIKAAGAERHAIERWLAPMLDQSLARLNAELSGSWYTLWLAFFSRAVRCVVFLWAGKACLAGELSVGSFVAFAMLSDNFVASWTGLLEALLALWSARPDIERVDALLAQPSEPLLRAHGAGSCVADADAVVLDDVWFRYGPDQPWILKGYSLRLRAGEHLTLRSASGSGKTTVLRLIAGLHRPERGTVSVFGRDPTLHRAHIAYLPQHAHLFAGSLLHNLRLLSGASLERIGKACHATGLAAFVSTLPMGLETVIPAGGGNLSGGQRQWILLTAALASERRLLLMDEALANLDALTRARLRQSASFAGKSVIWVSHED